MRNNPDDLSNQLLAKIEEWLEKIKKETEDSGTQGTKAETTQELIFLGYFECCQVLLENIETWKEELGL